MYIQAVVDPAERTFYDSYDQTAFWCVLTQTGLGPDRQPVRPDNCCDGLPCHRLARDLDEHVARLESGVRSG